MCEKADNNIKRSSSVVTSETKEIIFLFILDCTLQILLRALIYFERNNCIFITDIKIYVNLF